ncbi:NADH dehydrogenase subunit 3 (mitochondrion) [Sugiyamaella lignohabitans]|uniref:NADH-ubiquinone oxidoreductase chain 3 n=1 Tax=Sugiyamaella lignohabitans TaxID=796027 RepID=A0A167BWC7_9ASCO|nr:NADH dehydrogenase subunit 3 [Sugiyamaella lignohabitans]ANB10910.1 NADH dehydrogenase subunit 3 [Sugiyamaella lignohabitans]
MLFTSYTMYIYFMLMPIVSQLLLGINLLLSYNNTYNDKTIPFECGLSSFNQTRSAFSVSFILIAILFLPFDLEVSSILPYSLALNPSQGGGSYGLSIIIIFISILAIGFIYEYRTNALHIKNPSRDTRIPSLYNVKSMSNDISSTK